MFRVLNNLPRTSSGVQPVPQKDYLIREVQRNLQTIQNHYQGFTFAVQSDHILALLLAQLPMRYDISVQTYYDMILEDRKSTRLNSSHVSISYAVFCLKKKKN